MNRVLSLGHSLQREDAAPRPFFLGLQVSSDCRSVAGALVRATGRGRGLDAQVQLLASGSRDVAPQVGARFQGLLTGCMERPGDAGLIAAGLAEAQAVLVRQLLAHSKLAADDVAAIGVHDCGLWHVTMDGLSAYVGLCDGARLAEATGLCVIDAFPARDLACGGQGGPVTALASWIILRDPRRTRVLLDLGRTTRLTYLPAGRDAASATRVLALDVGPGTLLLDALAGRLSAGKYAHDPGGHLAVQGRRIPDVIDHWLNDAYFRRSPPRWHPLGVRPNDELNQTVEMAVRSGWSIRDLLCTATHFIADTVKRALDEQVPQQPPVEELLLAGGGQHNGMLLREIAVRLPGMALSRSWERGIADTVLEAMAVAVLALLHIDQVPANHPAITGTDAPRVLGRLTPGSTAAWRCLLREMEGRAHRTPLLRDAV